jgi:hypothetical protein
MSIAQADQVFQAFTAKIAPIFILAAILILVVGIPLYWFRLKLERALINRIHSAQTRRHAEKFTENMNVSVDAPHCPICNALMVKRIARRGAGLGSTF